MPQERSDGASGPAATRRSLVGATGTAAGVGLAGCSGRDDSREPTRSTTGEEPASGPPRTVETPSGEDGAAVQRAIDRVADRVVDGGHGFVEGRPDTVYEVRETISLPSNVYLRNFHFKLADGAQTTVIQSARFDELQGSNTWAADEGVPYNFGLLNVHVDGNKHNNGGRPPGDRGQGRWFASDPQDPDRTGRGIALYGKRYWVDNVVVRRCPRSGFYSEGATKGGQPSAWRDMPEAQIGRLWVRNCDGHGIVYRGPHDGQATALVGLLNDGHGFACERKRDTYTGAGLIVSRLHTYTNAEAQYLGDGFGALWNYVDNEPACILDAEDFFVHHLYASGGWTGPSSVSIDRRATIHTLRMNGEGEGTGLTVDAHETHIGRAFIDQYRRAAALNGLGTRIDHLSARSGSGDGVVVDGRDSYIGEALVQGYDGTGLTVTDKNVHVGRLWAQANGRDGIAIRANNTQVGQAAVPGNGRYGIYLGKSDDDIFGVNLTSVRLNRNDEAGFRYEGGQRNVVRLHGYVTEESTGYDTSGSGPGWLDDFTVHLGGPGSGVGLSSQQATTSLDGDGERRTFTVEHDLLTRPDRVQPTPLGEATPSIERVRRMSADDFEIQFATPPAAGTTARVMWEASLDGV
jgi:hypothetical protein